jgi:thiamine kinase-like enzyme
MNELVDMQNEIKQFYLARRIIQVPPKYIGVELKKIGGGYSNFNYMAVVKDMSTNERIAKILYRKFGALSKGANHDLEIAVINYLSKLGLGPKLIYEEPKGNFRLVEFLEGATTIPREKGLDSKLIDQIIPILVTYSKISYTYSYEIKKNKISLSEVKDNIADKRLSVSKNQYTTCVDEWIGKGVSTFKIFADQFKQKVSKDSDPENWEKFELVQYHLDNFIQEFNEIFPSKGFMVLSHNDTHRLNFLLRKKDQKLFILDHEYAYLNLPGNDMANYINEAFLFNYEPKYFCLLDNIDFDKGYQIYLIFYEQFIKTHKFLGNTNEGKEFLKNMKTKKYFLTLNNIINIFYFLWSICYVDYPTFEKDHIEEYYFVHAVDRIKVYLAGMKELKKLN